MRMPIKTDVGIICKVDLKKTIIITTKTPVKTPAIIERAPDCCRTFVLIKPMVTGIPPMHDTKVLAHDWFLNSLDIEAFLSSALAVTAVTRVIMKTVFTTSISTNVNGMLCAENKLSTLDAKASKLSDSIDKVLTLGENR